MSQPRHLAAYRMWTLPALQKAVAIGGTRCAMVFNGGVGKRLLNVEEAAGYLGLKVDTVYKKARLRELPFVKVGRALRFDKQALDRLIEQHTIKTID
jgi:excisionase family DNA binding protein